MLDFLGTLIACNTQEAFIIAAIVLLIIGFLIAGFYDKRGWWFFIVGIVVLTIILGGSYISDIKDQTQIEYNVLYSEELPEVVIKNLNDKRLINNGVVYIETKHYWGFKYWTHSDVREMR